jgi:hypothetical protein
MPEIYKKIFTEEDTYILSEKTFNIDNDVSYIYKKSGFEEFLNKLKFKKFTSINVFAFKFKDISSSELSSQDSILADIVMPINIISGIFSKGSFYNVDKNSEHLNYIQLSPIYKSIMYILDNDYDLTHLSKKDKADLNMTISEKGIKATIAHELSHWISDCLHNKHITKLLHKAMDLNSKEVLLLRQKNVNMTYFEIDAQVHSIKTLKFLHKGDWDNLTFTDVVMQYPAMLKLMVLIKDKFGSDILNIWQKFLLKRLHRESLLGKNMNNFVDSKRIHNNDFIIY